MNPPLPYKDHFRRLAALGIPIIIGQTGMVVLGFADTMMIGHYTTEALGAASFVNNMFNIVIIASTGFAYGLTPVIGELFGKKDTSGIGTALKNALAANFAAALIFMAAMAAVYFNIRNLNQPEELIPLIEPYYLIQLASLVFVLLFNAFRQFSEGIMDSRTAMWILLGGNLLNIGGNYLLIYGKAGFPELGLFGAGLATCLSRIAMLGVFILVFLLRPAYRAYREAFLDSAMDFPGFMKLHALGWPLALQIGMETAAFSLVAVMVGWLGTVPLAAHQVVLTISTLFFMLYYGMGAAASVCISYFKGQESLPDVRRAAFAGFFLIMAMAAVSISVFWPFRGLIAACFTGNAAVLSAIAPVIPVMMVYQFGDGLQIAFSNALRGIMDVRIMMLFSFISYFVISLPASYLFAFVMGLGLTGIWMAFPIALTSAGLLYFLRFLSRTRQLQ